MPFRDLRADDDTLDPLAPFIVLALMCYPRREDKQERDRMLSTVRAQTSVGKPRVSILTSDKFMEEVGYHAPRAAIYGKLLMTCIQFHELGKDHSLDAAIDFVKPLPERWFDKYWSAFDKDVWLTHMPHSRRKMIDAFNRFLSVSHLWAAHIYGIQNERKDIALDSNDTLPTFLAYAETFAKKAAKVPFRGPKRRFLLPDDQRWHFYLPAKLVKKV